MHIIKLASRRHLTAHFVFEGDSIHGGQTADIPFSYDPDKETAPARAIAVLLQNQIHPFDKWKGKTGKSDGWVFRYPAFSNSLL